MENNLSEQIAWAQFGQASLKFVDSEWLGFTGSAAVLSLLAQDVRFKAAVSRQLKAEFALEPLDDRASKSTLVKSLLLKGPVFVRRVAFLLGIVAYSEVVRRSIDGHLKRSFRELLNKNDFEFVTKRAAFCHPRLLAEFVPNKLLSESLTEKDMHVVGLWVLSVLMEPLGVSVLRRTNLMFSVGVVALVREHSQSRPVSAADVQRLDKLVNSLILETDGGG